MPKSRKKRKSPKRVLALPDLEQAKSAVLNTLTSKSGQRTYDHAITEFVEWDCSEPRLAFNRTDVLRYRISLEQRQYAPSTINLHLAAVRRIAYEAADSGMLSPELAPGIRRVKGVSRLGVRVGNWLIAEQGKKLLGATDTDTLRGRCTFGGPLRRLRQFEPFFVSLLISTKAEGFPTGEHMRTETLLEAMKKAPFANFELTFQEHYDLVYRTAYSVTRKAEDAEDVAQTVFLRLLRLEVPPDLTRNPKGYFYRAAVNASLRLIRSRRRMVLTGDTEQAEASTETGSSQADEALDQQLWAAIAELNERAAQILILRYKQGCSLAEVAKILGTSRSVVAVSLFRSRARLKKLIRAAETEES